jgi:hypothetical protein
MRHLELLLSPALRQLILNSYKQASLTENNLTQVTIRDYLNDLCQLTMPLAIAKKQRNEEKLSFTLANVIVGTITFALTYSHHSEYQTKLL